MKKYVRSNLYGWSATTVLALCCAGCDGNNNNDNGSPNLPPEDEEVSVVFVQGAPMNGSANGLYFDADDKLWVASA